MDAQSNGSIESWMHGVIEAKKNGLREQCIARVMDAQSDGSMEEQMYRVIEAWSGCLE